MAGQPENHVEQAPERDHLAVPAAVADSRRRPMSERLELALSWNAVAAELRHGLRSTSPRSR